jgi:hypothetical protein
VGVGDNRQGEGWGNAGNARGRRGNDLLKLGDPLDHGRELLGLARNVSHYCGDLEVPAKERTLQDRKGGPGIVQGETFESMPKDRANAKKPILKSVVKESKNVKK